MKKPSLIYAHASMCVVAYIKTALQEVQKCTFKGCSSIHLHSNTHTQRISTEHKSTPLSLSLSFALVLSCSLSSVHLLYIFTFIMFYSILGAFSLSLSFINSFIHSLGIHFLSRNLLLSLLFKKRKLFKFAFA